jgi:hypothetical protein
MKLIQLVYVSKTNHLFREKNLEKLAQRSRENNAKVAITGLLLYSPGFFMQLLEGEEDAIEKLYRIIQQDKRHSAVKCLVKRVVSKRSFPEWNMGLVNFNHYQDKIDLVKQKRLQDMFDAYTENENYTGDHNLAFDVLLEFLTPT